MKSEEPGKELQVTEHENSYRVDGEIGRFEFMMFDVKSSDNTVVLEGLSLFPYRKGKQWYQTCGFKELSLFNGAAQRSYRQTVKVFNRVRRQESGGTPVTTLRDSAESEGLKVIDFLEKKSSILLKKHGFYEQGIPEEACPVLSDVKKSCPSTHGKDKISRALKEVCDDMVKRDMSSEIIAGVREKGFNELYEVPEETAHIYIDDVGVKEQKEQCKTRDTQCAGSNEEEKNKLPTVQNTVARVEHKGNGFTLTGKSVMQVLRFVLSFLLESKMIGLRLIFITDGLRSLQNAIINFMAWHPFTSLLLDWFHLVKKFKEELSLACKGREIRNRHLRELLPLLWFGLVDRAKEYLEKIPAEDIKNGGAIKRLVGYLERNRKGIPCYALRSKLKLPNSSKPVEKSNNLVTSKRQKHNGMSWSKNGSYGLTALNAVVINDGVQQWIREHTISFELEKEAACRLSHYSTNISHIKLHSKLI